MCGELGALAHVSASARDAAPGALELDRLHGTRHTREILEVEVAEIQLPVAPGRNLAVLVEAAARSQILFHNGYDAAADFVERQRRIMNSEPL